MRHIFSPPLLEQFPATIHRSTDLVLFDQSHQRPERIAPLLVQIAHVCSIREFEYIAPGSCDSSTSEMSLYKSVFIVVKSLRSVIWAHTASVRGTAGPEDRPTRRNYESVFASKSDLMSVLHTAGLLPNSSSSIRASIQVALWRIVELGI